MGGSCFRPEGDTRHNPFEPWHQRVAHARETREPLRAVRARHPCRGDLLPMITLHTTYINVLFSHIFFIKLVCVSTVFKGLYKNYDR